MYVKLMRAALYVNWLPELHLNSPYPLNINKNFKICLHIYAVLFCSDLWQRIIKGRNVVKKRDWYPGKICRRNFLTSIIAPKQKLCILHTDPVYTARIPFLPSFGIMPFSNRYLFKPCLIHTTNMSNYRYVILV